MSTDNRPGWNCVDYPADGMHYTPGDVCEWCGKTKQQIEQERQNREAERHAYQPTERVGNPCEVCGFTRHHPWHNR